MDGPRQHPATPGAEHASELLDLFDATAGTEMQRDSGFWKPRGIGDILIGSVGRFYTTRHGRAVKIHRPDGFVASLGLNAVLQDLVYPALMGRYVAIQYTGEEDTGEDNPMRLFRVKVVEKHVAAHLWETYLASTDLPL